MNLNRHPYSFKAIALTACAIFLNLTVPSAHASPVSFNGGFTSFSGPVATAIGANAEFVNTQINGYTIFANEPLPGLQYAYDNFGVGLATSWGLLDDYTRPAASVDFSRIFFNQPNPNRVSFAPVDSVNVAIGESFKIGTFTITNGGWFGNDPGSSFFPDSDFEFSITTQSSDPALNGITFTDTLRFVVTNPPESSATVTSDADYFYFVGHPELGTMSVFELNDPSGNPTSSNVGSFDLIVKIGSIIPIALANPTGGAFIGNQVLSVPEPNTIGLMLFGVLVIALGAKGRLRSARAC